MNWRKFSLAFGTLSGAIVLAVLGKLTGEFVMIATVINGAHAAANAVEHVARSKSKSGQ